MFSWSNTIIILGGRKIRGIGRHPSMSVVPSHSGRQKTTTVESGQGITCEVVGTEHGTSLTDWRIKVIYLHSDQFLYDDNDD